MVEDLGDLLFWLAGEEFLEKPSLKRGEGFCIAVNAVGEGVNLP